MKSDFNVLIPGYLIKSGMTRCFLDPAIKSRGDVWVELCLGCALKSQGDVWVELCLGCALKSQGDNEAIRLLQPESILIALLRGYLSIAPLVCSQSLFILHPFC